MHDKYTFIKIVFLITIVIDFYVYRVFKRLINKKRKSYLQIFNILYWGFSILTLLFFSYSIVLDFYLWPVVLRTYVLAVIFIVVLSKLIVACFLIFEDITFLIQLAIKKITGYISSNTEHHHSSNTPPISRLTFISQIGVLIASIPFIGMLYGMIFNAYNYQLHKISIKLGHLPEIFNGLKIVQLSDIHSGSFTFSEPLKEAVEKINNLKPDFVFFTGDLVNYTSDEIVPFIDIFKNIKAKYGVFSVLGNHDYGDYLQWDSPKKKTSNMQQMYRFHKELGWNLLLNENYIFEKDSQKLAIIGVENWSSHDRFKKYGDLSKAAEGCEDCGVKLLLSHDPSHWEAQVTNQYKEIDITFSGHTHGMQFGVEIPGYIKWSPVQYMYKQWAGLYRKQSQYLYVNRGFGFIGYPGRIGILPEITFFQLQKA